MTRNSAAGSIKDAIAVPHATTDAVKLEDRQPDLAPDLRDQKIQVAYYNASRSLGEATRTRYKQIVSTDTLLCGVTTTEKLYCSDFGLTRSGDNKAGFRRWTYGYGTPAGRVTMVAAGLTSNRLCVLRPDATTACYSGTSPPNLRLKVLAPGDDVSCGLRTNGRAVCFMSPESRRNHRTALRKLAPVGVFTDLALYSTRTDRFDQPRWASPRTWRVCGLRADQSVVCSSIAGQVPAPSEKFRQLEPWGGITVDGSIGRWLSDGRQLLDYTNVALSGLALQPLVSLSYNSRCGLNQEGAIICAFTPDASPDQVAPGPYQQIALVGNREVAVCGLTPDGLVECWRSGDEVPPTTWTKLPEPIIR